MLKTDLVRQRVCALVLACFAVCPALLFAAWPTETVATQTTGNGTSAIPLAIAYRRGLFGGRIYQERIFVAYHHIANRDLVVASRDSNGLWTATTVESAGETGFDPDITIDSAGNPHAVHFDNTNNRYRYARRVGTGGNCGPQSSWNCETIPVPAGYYLGSTAKIVIATDGRIHVAFRAATDTGGYRFGHLSSMPGQAWSEVDWIVPGIPTPDASLLSLDLDSVKSPHVAFLAPASGSYKAFQWARKVNGAWVVESAPGAWSGGGRMVIAGDDHPRACLNQAPLIPNGALPQVHRGVRNTDGTWTTSLHADDARACDIAVTGAQNYRRFVHAGGSSGMIHFSQEMPLNPGTYFTLETVWAGTNPDLTLDYQGKALVAFSYPSTGTVFFSRQP